MENRLSLYLILLIAVLIAVGFRIGTNKKRKKQKEEYPKLWEQFKSIKDTDAHKDIIEIGTKLMFSNFVPTEHLEIIQKTAQDLESKNPEFETLRKNAKTKLTRREHGEGSAY